MTPTQTDLEIFNEARKLYPHNKLGLENEFENFRKVCKKIHKSTKEVLPLLKPAIKRQIQWRKEVAQYNYGRTREFHKFTPQWKDFKSWIYNRYWELEFELPSEERARKEAEKKHIKGLPPVSLQPVPAAKELDGRKVKELLEAEG